MKYDPDFEKKRKRKRELDKEYCPKYTHEEMGKLLNTLNKICAARDEFQKLNVNRSSTWSEESYEMMCHIYNIDGHLKQAIDEFYKLLKDTRFFELE